MVSRAALVWLGLLALAIANGALRELVLVPRLGDYPAHVVSVVLLCAAILAVTRATIAWMGPAGVAQAVLIGQVWTLATVAFEFGGGRYVFDLPWETLWRDYRLVEGRVWLAVIATTLFAPVLMRRTTHRDAADGDEFHRDLSWRERRAIEHAARRADRLFEE